MSTYSKFLFADYIVDVKDVNNSEELVLNTVATLNNLSFYNDADSVVQQRQGEITESKFKFYFDQLCLSDNFICPLYENYDGEICTWLKAMPSQTTQDNI